MISFDSFYTELISDQRWYELLRHYKDETIRKAAEKVWAQLVADKIEDVRPMSENRKHLYNLLIKNPGDKVALKNWAAKALEIQEAEKEKEWQPVSWDKRAEYLKQVQEIIKGSTMMSGVHKPSYKEQAEEGLDRPKNMPPYPVTTPEEAYVRDRHFEWIKNNFEARTGQKLPSWICEEDWNVIYDDQHLNGKGL